MSQGEFLVVSLLGDSRGTEDWYCGRGVGQRE